MNATSKIRPMREVTEIRDGMAIDWDIPIEMDDGLVLRADVYRPTAPGRYPVILSYGPYAKWLAFQDGYSTAWEIMIKEHPDVLVGSSSKYQSWEVADPEKWVPDGYVCLRIDSRGAGRSPGYIDPFSPRETQDIYHAIEWAARQPWSSGKVGMNGISYYAINAWQVASLQPPHLAAICVWEGAGDWYRDKNHQGGILCTFQANWYDMQVKTVQHGLGERRAAQPHHRRSRVRAANHDGRGAREVPLRFRRDDLCPSPRRCLPPRALGRLGQDNGAGALGRKLGWQRASLARQHRGVRPRRLHARNGSRFTATGTGPCSTPTMASICRSASSATSSRARTRAGISSRACSCRSAIRARSSWRGRRTNGRSARTRWTKFYLDPSDLSLSEQPANRAEKAEYDALGDGLTFVTAPLERETEVTGPSAAKLFVSSSTPEADLFLVLQVFAPDGKEVVFQGALDPHTPIGQGWLRASHRKLDSKLSTPYRPYHTHDEKQPLEPGEIVEIEVEIWPTSIVIPPGYRLGLQVRGKDYVYKGASGGRLSNMKNEFTGCGPFLHDDPRDRPPEASGRVTLHSGPGMQPYLLLPIIPSK